MLRRPGGGRFSHISRIKTAVSRIHFTTANLIVAHMVDHNLIQFFPIRM